MPIPHEADSQALPHPTPEAARRKGIERPGREPHQGEEGGVREPVPTMESQMDGNFGQALFPEVRQDTVHPQEATVSHAQRGVLSAIPFHIPDAGMQRHAQHEQQDRRDFHGSEKESEQPQRDVGREPQAVHQWVFLGIG